jgi:hypothetical protein
MQCGSTEPLVGRLDYLRSLGEAIQSFQILACQIAQNARIDVVFGKALRVLGHAERCQPFCNRLIAASRSFYPGPFLVLA